MSAIRVRIVLPAFESPVSPFIGLSASIHLLGLVAMLFLPGFFAPDRPAMMPSTIDAILIAPDVGTPRLQAPRPAPTQAAPQKTPPPKGPSAVPIEPKKVTESLPIEEPKVQPEPKPQQPSPTPPRPVPHDPNDDASERVEDLGPVDAGASSEPIGSPGAGAALEGMGAEFDWYREAVVRALFSSWRRPFARNGSEVYEVAIAFEILRDGRVRGVQIVTPSGDNRLDRSALRAVQEASLPPLPRNYRVAAQPAQFVFRLSPDTGF